MEYRCHFWASAHDWYLCMFDKLLKWVYRNVCPTAADFLEPLEHCQNVASHSLFYRYYFGRYPSKLAELVPLILVGAPRDVISISMSTVFFPG